MPTPRPHFALALPGLAACLLFSACSSHDLSLKSLSPDEKIAAATEGYSLLYAVARDNSGVDAMILIKSVSAPTADLIKKIAKSSGDAAKFLDEHRKSLAGAGVELDRPGLPKVEAAARARIATLTRNALLFGHNVERDLLLSQAESTRYMAALAAELAELEPNDDFSKWLSAFSKQMLELRDHVAARLQVVPEPPASQP